MDKRTLEYVKYYNKKGANYARDFRWRMLLTGGEQGFRKKLHRQIEHFIRGDVLEVCCGPGTLTKFIHESHPDCNITGIDISDKFIELAQKEVPHPNVHFEVGDASNLRFESNRFDTVVLSLALHEMDSHLIKKVLAEIHRVTKPEGLAVLIEHHLPKNPIMKLYYDRVVVDDHERKTAYAFHRYGLRRYMEEAAYDVVNHDVILSGCMQVMVARPGADRPKLGSNLG